MSTPNLVLEEASIRGKTVHLDLWYPRSEANVNNVILGLIDFRATDEIRISYDFERDGWKIEQQSTFSWASDDEVCDPDWQEVAFVKSWAREKPETRV